MPTKLVVCGWLERDGKVLVTKRRPKGHLPSLWEFPGGKVEPGEGPRAALRRELREELGIECVIGREISRTSYDYGSFIVELVLLDVPYHEGAVQHLEVEDSAWVAHTWFNENAANMPPADLPLVAEAVKTHATCKSVDPSTDRPVAETRLHDVAAATTELEHLQHRQAIWASLPVADRTRALQRVAACLRQHAPLLARLAALEMGKPITEGLAEVEKCARTAEYYAREGAQLLAPKPLSAELSKRQGQQVLQPLGVVLGVMPWNFPFWQVLRAAMPGWLLGNAMLIKPASVTSLCTFATQAALEEAFGADAPVGVAMIASRDVAALIAHPGIAAATLTGSEKAGASVAATAGSVLKKTVLELGGSDPVIIFADANLDLAVDQAVKTRLQNCGQSCIAGKRFIVHESLVDAFSTRFAAAADELKVGPATEATTQLGPMASREQRDALQEQLDASLQLGSERLSGADWRHKPGAFFAPTLVRVHDKRASVWSAETFGPIAALMSFKDESEAVELANDSRFGLAAAVFTKDRACAERVATQLVAGTVTINGMTISDPALPFGGLKVSGYGRELSALAVSEFANIKTIVIAE